MFDRDEMINELEKGLEWDVIVIGGGSTGLGIAVDSASRGYKTLLLEQSDFAKGTSSRSTKLVHGGVRYLEQGNFQLVFGALRERGILLKNAPHLVKKQSFIIPCYNILDQIKYVSGLKIYDWLSGRLSFGRSRILKKKEVLKRLPNIKDKNLVGGVEYFDGQFDDARLAINLAKTCAENGGTTLNYFKVKDLTRLNGKINGALALDMETRKEYSLRSKAIINATGVFVDDILKMDDPDSIPIVKPSQGVHIVVKHTFLNSESALMIPKTSDGRVLFAVPWHEHTLLGTTDIPIEKHSLEPVAHEEEINFILETVQGYLADAPQSKDIVSVFAGLRPLVINKKNTKSTKEISRDHKIMISASGLVSITGGKWTTYRKMAEETLRVAIHSTGLTSKECKTKYLSIHGCTNSESNDHLAIYGTDAKKISELMDAEPLLNKRLINYLPYLEAEVVWAARSEMARTIEDVLARRLRILFLDAKAAISAAMRTVELLSKELNKSEEWKQQQLQDFYSVAENYVRKDHYRTN